MLGCLSFFAISLIKVLRTMKSQLMEEPKSPTTLPKTSEKQGLRQRGSPPILALTDSLSCCDVVNFNHHSSSPHFPRPKEGYLLHITIENGCNLGVQFDHLAFVGFSGPRPQSRSVFLTLGTKSQHELPL